MRLFFSAITVLSLAFLSVVVSPPRARADLAPPAPEDLTCPRGAMGAVPTVPDGALDGRGRPLRPFPYCAPTTCTSDAECTGGRVCSAEEIGLCVEPLEVIGGGSVTVRSARDRGCEPDNTCLNLASTCERARRCVMPEAAPPPPPPAPEPPPPPPPPPPATPAAETASSGCACTVPSHRGGDAATATLASLLALGVVVARRRARRS